MLRFLFRRLTDEPGRGRALFEQAVAEARQPHWYLAGEVPDTIDGRFAMLATVCALIAVRLERSGEASQLLSAALTERFIEAMDAEHRELGLNDPGLGRKVRKLVGALERRVDDWRSAAQGKQDWDEAVVSSVYRGTLPSQPALESSGMALRDLWSRLSAASDTQLPGGDF